MELRNAKRVELPRLRACFLLVCLLSGPFQAIAAPWLQETPACCASGMCPIHSHSQKAKQPEPSCDHGKENRTSDCVMKCGDANKESASVTPNVPGITLPPSPTESVLVQARGEFLTEQRVQLTGFLSLPDHPPRF